ncbi:hypothetical protein HDV05_005536 [Chytridiales sp. JEL 0842]|nr:hypothetical protein HDV05_005536 [Chytridiales sp. JEL 0842]
MSSATTIKIGRSTSGAPAFLSHLVNNQDDADVIILCGEDEKPIYAHSIILKAQSEYFKTALSFRWSSLPSPATPASTRQTRNTRSKSIESTTPLPSKGPHTIRKPNISYDVMLSIIKILYTTTCDVPADLVLSVLSAGNELLLDEEVVTPCLDCIVTDILVPSNAFKIYALAYKCREPSKEFRNEIAFAVTKNLQVALADGADDLLSVCDNHVRALLKSPIMSNVEKWRIALHYSMSSQFGCAFKSMDHISQVLSEDEGPCIAAANVIYSVLPIISLFRMEDEDLKAYVMPAISLLPVPIQHQIRQFQKSTLPYESIAQLSQIRQLPTDLCSVESFREMQKKFNAIDNKHRRWVLKFSLARADISHVILNPGDILLLPRADNKGVCGFYHTFSNSKLFTFIDNNLKFFHNQGGLTPNTIKATPVINSNCSNDDKKFTIDFGRDLRIAGVKGRKAVEISSCLGSHFSGVPSLRAEKLEIYKLK